MSDACVMLVSVALHVINRSVLLELIHFQDTVMRLAVIALVVVFATTPVVSVLASQDFSVLGASTRQQ